MSYAGENLMVGGEGRHFDSLPTAAAAARHQAELAQTLTTMLTDAIRRGHNPPIVRNAERSTLASDALCEMYGPEQDILFRACHLALAGKFEASTAELLTFIHTAAKRFGENAAESLLEED